MPYYNVHETITYKVEAETAIDAINFITTCTDRENYETAINDQWAENDNDPTDGSD